MILDSFADELVKVGAHRPLRKLAYGGALEAEPPAGMTGSDPPPPEEFTDPADVRTRLPRTAHKPSNITVGTIGDVTPASRAIDEKKFNRPEDL